jgi:hypothetical protein
MPQRARGIAVGHTPLAQRVIGPGVRWGSERVFISSQWPGRTCCRCGHTFSRQQLRASGPGWSLVCDGLALPRVLARVRGAHRSPGPSPDRRARATPVRRQPERDAILAWLRVVAIHEAYRLSAIDRRDARGQDAPRSHRGLHLPASSGRGRATAGAQCVNGGARLRRAPGPFKTRALAAAPRGSRRRLDLLVHTSRRERAHDVGGALHQGPDAGEDQQDVRPVDEELAGRPERHDRHEDP